MSDQENVTQLLIELSEGKQATVDDLLPLVYGELKKMAANYLRKERPDHTLQPTALVNEAYLRLVDQTRVSWQNRAHFFGIAAQMMRRILIDHARAQKAGKRLGNVEKLQLDENIDKAAELGADLVALDEALRHLAQTDAQLARLVELRFFAGLTVEETAAALDVSPVTVKRDRAHARAWLFRELQRPIP